MLTSDRWHLQLVRFWLVGILNATIDLGGFNLLVATFHVYSGSLVGVLSVFSASAAMINSYVFNRQFTFGINDNHRIEHINRFAIASVIGILINSGLVAAVSLLTPHLPFTPHLVLSLAKILGMSSEGLWNFFIYRHWVFV
ncbi:MAG: GtrA family protein [Methanomassiliicoccales archaeon]